MEVKGFLGLEKGWVVKKIFLRIVLLLILANVGFGDVIQILGSNYSIYKGNVYYGNEILEGANPKTAELIGFSLLKDDKNHVYIGNSSIGLWKLDKIENPETFEFLSDTINTDSFYGKDKYNVYYVNRIFLSCFGTYTWIGFKVEGINRDKVEVLNDWFIKDDKNIYFEGKILEGVDYNTFEVLPNGDGKDKNRSYEYLTKD